MMPSLFKNLSTEVKQYLLITGNYWAFTLTDGALRMLVILYFHQLGYSPLQIAMLFLFYEFFGVVTNLIGGWLGARLGLNKIMNIGLFLQVVALAMLLVPTSLLNIVWVMAAQALSGIAKDLNKMSAKSSIKTLVVADQQGQLYQWVALLTGSKNTLKGIGFFLGGFLLTLVGFKGAIASMAVALSLVWVISMLSLQKDLGKAKNKPKFREIFSKSPSINYLSAARLFLFASRDVWFVVALPVFLSTQLQWSHSKIGGFIAFWIIGYGIIQSLAPYFTGKHQGITPTGRSITLWAISLSAIPAMIVLTMKFGGNLELALIIGLLIFGGIFAINSSLHSYLIICYASDDGVSMDVGFYYMANAVGRLMGTILSGWLFQIYGFEACLIVSSVFLSISAIISLSLPK